MGTTRFCGFNSILTDQGGPIWKKKKFVFFFRCLIEKSKLLLEIIITIKQSILKSELDGQVTSYLY